MVRERMKLMCKFPRLTVIALLSATILQFGCVSTEELYAEYDESLCQLVPEQSPNGELLLREKISNSLFHWEPAVYFAFDDQVLSDEAKEKLLSVLPVIKKYPHLLLSLQGFTDSIGSISYNRKLANRRVNAVSEFMATQGVNGNRLVVQTLGEGLKTVGESSEVTRALNRRVELMLLDGKGKPISMSVDPESILLRYLKNADSSTANLNEPKQPTAVEAGLKLQSPAAVPSTVVPVPTAVKTVPKKLPVPNATTDEVPTPSKAVH